MKKILTLCLTLLLLISITACSGEKNITTAELNTPVQEPKKMIFLDGELYIETGKEGDQNRLCGTPDGIISTTVSINNTPTQENQSNFGTGFGYQRTCDCEIDVLIDGKWQVFQTKEGHKNTSILAPPQEVETDSCCVFDPNKLEVPDCND